MINENFDLEKNFKPYFIYKEKKRKEESNG